MTTNEAGMVATIFGVLITALFSTIMWQLRDMRKKVTDICHNLWCHRHIESGEDEGQAYVPKDAQL